MAQAMLLSSGTSISAGHPNAAVKRDTRLLSQVQKIKPSYASSHLFFSPLPSLSSSSSSSLKTFALFKSKTKAPAKKVVAPKTKPKVEDGIFGTSGGIGFTKQNELFVGRVAMIGFAEEGNASYPDEDSQDPSRISKNPPGFSTPVVIAAALSLVIFLLPPASLAEGGGAALFRRACIGCHVDGGNVIQPGATLFAGDLERNGAASEEEIYRITYAGKGRMPGFGLECTPRGQCTFGQRLTDEEIRALAQFVKSQANLGWPKINDSLEE